MVYGIVCYDIVLSFVDDVVVVILSDWRNTSAGPSENLKMLPAWPCMINTSRLGLGGARRGKKARKSTDL